MNTLPEYILSLSYNVTNVEACRVRKMAEQAIGERTTLVAALQRLLRAFEADMEICPKMDILTCWETNSQAIQQAREALAMLEQPTKEGQ